ncbi:hypothetical protein BDV96DRAFT_594853 [Lophiotrema nucula]|uniref:Uncharacterized protein n=1 Tax=Lophiotrema nucula TaxID=690887 RepID=A0A6A5ZPQ4_9PLEO|nr:hypothetical protein BDV96DRAFT_594853 [Lophiotrema nucula]
MAASTTNTTQTRDFNWADDDDDWSYEEFTANNKKISAPTLAELGPLQRPSAPEDLEYSSIALQDTTEQSQTPSTNADQNNTDLEDEELPTIDCGSTPSPPQLDELPGITSELMLYEYRSGKLPEWIITYGVYVLGYKGRQREREWDEHGELRMPRLHRGMRSPLWQEVRFEEEELDQEGWVTVVDTGPLGASSVEEPKRGIPENIDPRLLGIESTEDPMEVDVEKDSEEEGSHFGYLL